jgi:hypothetical protein
MQPGDNQVISISPNYGTATISPPTDLPTDKITLSGTTINYISALPADRSYNFTISACGRTTTITIKFFAIQKGNISFNSFNSVINKNSQESVTATTTIGLPITFIKSGSWPDGVSLQTSSSGGSYTATIINSPTTALTTDVDIQLNVSDSTATTTLTFKLLSNVFSPNISFNGVKRQMLVGESQNIVATSSDGLPTTLALNNPSPEIQFDPSTGALKYLKNFNTDTNITITATSTSGASVNLNIMMLTSPTVIS